MAKKKKQKPNVVFRRIRGRIVPIKVSDKNQQRAGVAAAAVGTVAAADAARTKTILVDKKKNITIDKKKFARRSFGLGLADELVIKVKGKKAGYANIGRLEDDVFTFNMLKVNPKHRGKGLSKILTTESAREMKRQGAGSISNQVIHEGSLKGKFSGKRDKIFHATRHSDKRISKKKALDIIGKERRRVAGSAFFFGGKRKRKSPAKIFKRQRFDDTISAAMGIHAREVGVFRETSLKGVRKTSKFGVKAFRSTGNKLQIAGGLALAAGGVALATAKRRRKKKEK